MQNLWAWGNILGYEKVTEWDCYQMYLSLLRALFPLGQEGSLCLKDALCNPLLGSGYLGEESVLKNEQSTQSGEMNASWQGISSLLFYSALVKGPLD